MIMTKCLLTASNWVTNLNQELTIDREEEYFSTMSEGSVYALGRRVGGGTKEESLAWLVSEGRFRGGFLRVVTAELRLNVTPCHAKSYPGKVVGQSNIAAREEGKWYVEESSCLQ